MNTEEDNNRQGNLNTPTREEELVVELNSKILKTIQCLQADLHSFKDDNMNERKEQKSINEYLLWNMTGGILHGHPTHSTNKSKKYFYHKQASSPKEEHTPEPPEIYYHSISSDNSLSP